MDRDKSIIAQNAGTTAANLVASAVAAGTLSPDSVDELVSTFDAIRTGVFNGTLSLAGAESVVESFEDGFADSRPAQRSSAPSGGSSGAGGVEIKFGKHRGKTIEQVYGEAPDYVEWMAEKANNEFMQQKAREYLAAVA